MGRNIGGCIKNEGAEKVFQNHNIVSYTVRMDVTHTFVVYFIHVITHFPTGLYVYELTITCPPNKCATGKSVIPHKALRLAGHSLLMGRLRWFLPNSPNLG